MNKTENQLGNYTKEVFYKFPTYFYETSVVDKVELRGQLQNSSLDPLINSFLAQLGFSCCYV